MASLFLETASRAWTYGRWPIIQPTSVTNVISGTTAFISVKAFHKTIGEDDVIHTTMMENEISRKGNTNVPIEIKGRAVTIMRKPAVEIKSNNIGSAHHVLTKNKRIKILKDSINKLFNSFLIPNKIPP